LSKSERLLYPETEAYPVASDSSQKHMFSDREKEINELREKLIDTYPYFIFFVQWNI
jgi:hypothetical protein